MFPFPEMPIFEKTNNSEITVQLIVDDYILYLKKRESGDVDVDLIRGVLNDYLIWEQAYMHGLDVGKVSS